MTWMIYGANGYTGKMALKLMDNSSDTVDSVADKVFKAAERGKFLIIPTKREPMLWRLKRWFPSIYFKVLIHVAKSKMK